MTYTDSSTGCQETTTDPLDAVGFILRDRRGCIVEEVNGVRRFCDSPGTRGYGVARCDCRLAPAAVVEALMEIELPEDFSCRFVASLAGATPAMEVVLNRDPVTQIFRDILRKLQGGAK